MPNTKQAKKRMETDDIRRMRNKVVRSSMRSAVKKVLSAETTADAQAALPTAFKQVDKAAKKNIIHDNAAARKKAQLNRHIQKLNG
ncbi:30S ribosomal protein S20 [Planctomycetes bacterium Poly30]|uniref:Small ribosomal subunit protein bS20 n=1 Tax=Saltatorellus ferox TaxID=2528018 RepID=A0A518F023_9BACT|nr:30S ribosomal protein S20 [Planctomycetes bacterium Poly30]